MALTLTPHKDWFLFWVATKGQQGDAPRKFQERGVLPSLLLSMACPLLPYLGRHLFHGGRLTKERKRRLPSLLSYFMWAASRKEKKGSSPSMASKKMVFNMDSKKER